MKTELTIEESARLIELGVDPKLASKVSSAIQTFCGCRGITRLPVSRPIFDLSDILSILPKEIKTSDSVMGADFICALRMDWDAEWKMWHCGYTALPRPIEVGITPELIDALNSLLIWCLTEKKINLNTEKQ